VNFHIHRDLDAVAVAAADRVESEIQRYRTLSVGLAGGSTPRIVHRILAGRAIDWAGVTAWMTDERWVDPADGESNQRMVRETLVTEVGLTFLAPDTTLEEPEAAAEAFEATLIEHHIHTSGRSLVMLGMGADGHTASLFPETNALTVSGRSYVPNWVGAHEAWRLTATYDLLSASDTILFLVAGKNKAEVMADIANGGNFPAATVSRMSNTIWLLDEAAASKL
jgi:6-phosphogluconolactonase